MTRYRAWGTAGVGGSRPCGATGTTVRRSACWSGRWQPVRRSGVPAQSGGSPGHRACWSWRRPWRAARCAPAVPSRRRRSVRRSRGRLGCAGGRGWCRGCGAATVRRRSGSVRVPMATGRPRAEPGPLRTGAGLGLVGGDRRGAGDDERDAWADAGEAGLLSGSDVAAGLVGAAAADRGFDLIQDHPSPRNARARSAEGVDLGDLYDVPPRSRLGRWPRGVEPSGRTPGRPRRGVAPPRSWPCAANDSGNCGPDTTSTS